MEPQGIIKSVDSFGRINIPSSILKAIGVGNGDLIEVTVGRLTNGSPCVIIEKYPEKCCICSKKLSDGQFFETTSSKRVCLDCKEEFSCQK